MSAQRSRPRQNAAAVLLESVRGGYGVLQLAAPELIADRLLHRPLDERGRLLARVLGARQLAQTLASGMRPTYPVLALGVEVDALHAASMLALAVTDRGRRRAALTDALIAGSFALGGVLAARAAARRVPAPETADGLRGMRRRCADWLARFLVPGYPGASAARTPIQHDRWAWNPEAGPSTNDEK